MKKKIIIIILIIILMSTVSILIIDIKNKNKIAVLGYHGILPAEINISGDDLIVDREKFEKELKFLKILNYKTMTLDEFYCWKNGECEKEKKSVLITFDDGYMNNYKYAFDLLKKYNMNAVVFCVGYYVEGDGIVYMNKDTIEEIKKKYPNIEIASHSYNLHYHSEKTYEIVNEDAKKMANIIETNYYAYPFGDMTDEYINALKDNNYKLAFTFGPSKEHRKADIKDDNYLIPRLNISNDMPIIKFILRVFLPM